MVLFIYDMTRLYLKCLNLPMSSEQIEIQELYSCCLKNKTTASHYSKRFTIWELGENKFT
jgi:hypothetical protein